MIDPSVNDHTTVPTDGATAIDRATGLDGYLDPDALAAELIAEQAKAFASTVCAGAAALDPHGLPTLPLPGVEMIDPARSPEQAAQFVEGWASDAAPAPIVPASKRFVDETTGEVIQVGSPTPLDITQLVDESLAEYIDGLEKQRRIINEAFTAHTSAAKFELERRMRERNAKAIPSKAFEIEMEPEFAPYMYNVEHLRAAAKLLPEKEAAKIFKHVPEQTTVIPAHDEAGSAVSINALIKRYGADTEIGKLLSAGATRVKTGDKLKFKRRPEAQPVIKNVTDSASNDEAA